MFYIQLTKVFHVISGSDVVEEMGAGSAPSVGHGGGKKNTFYAGTLIPQE